MNILKRIKAERHIPLSHWRYQLLHFTFGIRPKNIEEAVSLGMKRYLYNHYCPLFHLTNIFVILFPAIVAFRFLSWLFKRVGRPLVQFLGVAIDGVMATIQSMKPEPSEEEKALKATQENRIHFIKFVKSHWENNPDYDFNIFWEWFCNCNYQGSLKKEDAEPLFVSLMEKLARKRERKEKEVTIRNEKILLLIRVSESIIKVALSCFYVMAGMVVLWALWNVGVFVVTVIFPALWSAIAADIILSMIEFLICMVGIAVAVIATGIFFEENGVFNWFGKMLKSPLVALGKAIEGAADFISMFYEENCPRIVIVDEETALIEED